MTLALTFGQVKTQLFQNTVAYQIKGNEIFEHTQTFRPYTHQRSKQFFSENSHIAYQIKENDSYNNMQATILYLCTPWVGFQSSKLLFLKVVTLHITLTVMKCTITRKQIFALMYSLVPWVEFKGHNTFFY